tara:strand:- start:2036 stop:2434 length:399 start_codon:yes stop_codon:yes gene_type:complete
MKDSSKLDNAYKTIGEVAKSLNLIDKKTGSPQTHTLRYWETQFKQIRPTVRAGNRRYYSTQDFEKIKLIKFLLKDKGLTINGAKKILKDVNMRSIDVNINKGIYKPTDSETKTVKVKLNKILKIIKELKKFK